VKPETEPFAKNAIDDSSRAWRRFFAIFALKISLTAKSTKVFAEIAQKKIIL
jgi:hypothetical protein